MQCKWASSAMVAVILIWTFGTGAEGRNHHRHGRVTGCSWCKPGYHVVQSSGKGRDTGCAPCPKGTYLPHQSYKRQCYLCSQCGQDLYVAHACTPSRDTVCDSCHTVKGPHNQNFYVRCQETQPPSSVTYSHMASETLDSVPSLLNVADDRTTVVHNRSTSDVVVNELRESKTFLITTSLLKSDNYSKGDVELLERRFDSQDHFSHRSKTILLVAMVILCAMLCLLLGIAVNRWWTLRHRKTRPHYQYEAVNSPEVLGHQLRINYEASRTEKDCATSPEEMTRLYVT